MNSLRLHIEQQLNEIQLLRSCYSAAGEFHLEDAEAYNQAQEFVCGTRSHIQRSLGFILKIHLIDINKHAELQFTYPFQYPELPAEIHLRTYLSRECYEKFNESLKAFLKDRTPSEEPYLLEVISWIQDNQTLFTPANDTSPKRVTAQSIATNKNFSRLWIYSHHIYSIEKRKRIIDWAHELNLNGFSFPGKPGIICVEGQESDVNEYWTRLRSLTWKKLQIKEKQCLGEECGYNLHFDQFQELCFVNNNHERQDLGQLYQYLQSKQLDSMFCVLFGFSGADKK